MIAQEARGYIRFPTIHHDCIVFTAEDALWRAPATGGRAERLTAGVAEATDPRFSPDGKWIAFTGCNEGPNEVYIMRATGGPAKRLTYYGGDARVVGWSRDSNAIIYSSSASQPFPSLKVLFQVSRCGGKPADLGYGLAHSIAYGPGEAVVIGRHTIEDSSHWKGYRGGTAGQLWVDMEGTGNFQRILSER